LSFLESNPELFLRESVHRVAYSGALGNPLFPTKEALGTIHRGAVRNFFLVISFVPSSYPLYNVCIVIPYTFLLLVSRVTQANFKNHSYSVLVNNLLRNWQIKVQCIVHIVSHIGYVVWYICLHALHILVILVTYVLVWRNMNDHSIAVSEYLKVSDWESVLCLQHHLCRIKSVVFSILDYYNNNRKILPI
jgi:hypothetical protein